MKVYERRVEGAMHGGCATPIKDFIDVINNCTLFTENICVYMVMVTHGLHLGHAENL